MKKLLIILNLSLLLTGCTKNDDYRDNPYLIDQDFSYQIDMNLPQYNGLRYPMNSIVIDHIGINGIVISHTNGDQYTAFELTDPNHPITGCSNLNLQDMTVSCSCDDGNVYTTITGQQMAGEGEYSLKPYRIVELEDGTLEISN